MAGGCCRGGGRHGRRPRAFGARGYGARNHLTPKKKAGEKEESEGILTAGKNKDAGGSGTAVRAEVRTAAGGALPCGGCDLRGVGEGENGVGRAGERAGGCSAPLNRGRGAGGAPTTHVVVAVAAAPGAGGSEPRGRKGTAPTGGARASAAREGDAATVAARPFGWAGPAAVLGHAARKGEASWAGAACAEEKASGRRSWANGPK
ncbi:uncharacterized protein [Miscanthus floridulus]|uniref:uncharacterized protein n=1 Tax=Miscanthus floridulus TaxID=154761 RepID=UPI0034592AEE